MAVWLILASAFLHAFWNARLKRQPEMDVAGSVIFLVTGLTGVAAALAQWTFGAATPFPTFESVGWSLAAGVCEAGYFTLLVVAFRLAPLGTVYAVSRGFAIVATWPLSVLWLGEAVSAPALAGTAIVLAGLLLSTLKLDVCGRAVLIALASGLFIAGYHIFYKLGMAAGGQPAAVFALSLGVAVPVNIALLARERRARLLALWRERVLSLTALGIICGASFLLILLALELAGAAYVLTLRNASILFALLLAWQLGETLHRRQWAGAGLIALGAALLGMH